MFGGRRVLWVYAVPFLLAIGACEIPSTITITTNPGPSSGGSSVNLSCAASVPTSTVQSGVAVPVTIQVSETPTQFSPYTISDESGTFAGTTTVSRTYSNSGSTSVLFTDSFTVNDSKNNQTVCSINVTVLPVGAPANSGVSCQVQAFPSNVHEGDPINFLFSASGGASPYTFSAFGAGSSSAQVTQSLTQEPPFEATAIAKYSSPGVFTSTAIATDSEGNTATCNQSITVNAQPSLSVAVSPASIETDGTPIVLTATPSGFFGNPTYAFTTTEPNIKISVNSNVATVTSLDSATHDFYVTATANSQTSTNQDQAYQVVHLRFLTSLALNCSLVASNASPNVGDLVTYTASASDGEKIDITQFTTNGLIVGNPSSSSIQVKYEFAGSQSVSASAVSDKTGTACNSGSSLTSSVKIVGNPVCSASFSQNPSSSQTPITLSVSVPGVYEAGAVQIISVEPSSSAPNEPLWVQGSLSPTSAQVEFLGTGSFPVTVTVQDNAGNTAQCSATEVINR